ncbi:DUF4134 domain-containing protein [Chitinophaga sedimenti]|uniref:DUF4134 domain-containing protein n=1 Tax=Chitinophaga sedimenti TaxID=2033606 RepID=UPI0020046BCC|nr:DUF4134 domain-containing protein [Chitinophaga sedimenti]MCK7559440.1 DUF4134 domain-containing protein [Chitinophaga sedimenti]
MLLKFRKAIASELSLLRPLPADYCAFGCFLISAAVIAQTQPVNAEEGLTNAYTEVTRYFDYGIDLMYAVGAVLGIVGAVKVYNKWNSGEQDTSKVATSWFGSCIFLVVVATILKGFFGIQ